MSALRFTNGRVLRGAVFDDADLWVAGDTIVAGALDTHDTSETIDLEGGYLAPGFIDTQVNGGGGVLFNDAPTIDTIARIAAAHRVHGTTSLLPTLISDDLPVIDAAMRAVEAALEAGVPGVAGIHIEGPFINPARRGTHDAARMRRLDRDAIALLGSLRHGRTLVTLAPELCTPDDLAALAMAGVILSAGHTDADAATMHAAFASGVTGVTHLYNAMSPFSHRAPGAVGAVLDDQSAYVGLIADGRHVDPIALRVAVRARPRDRFMLVTDAMPTVGHTSGSFRLQGKAIRVVDGVCVEEDGTLAGSDLDMTRAVANMVRFGAASVAEAAVMAATAPAAFLRLADRGVLAPGRRADLVWLDADLALRGVWIGGCRQGLA